MPSCESGSPNCHFTCPFGRSWHVCRDPPCFVGCCSSDPCSNGTASACPLENLYAAAFEPDRFDELTPANCIGHSAANWYTCNFTFQSFIGCCETNPCAETKACPFGKVLPAAWPHARTPFEMDAFLVEPTLKSNVYNSLFSSDGDMPWSIPKYSCPSSNCTWDPVTSLEARMLCANITESLVQSCHNISETDSARLVNCTAALPRSEMQAWALLNYTKSSFHAAEEGAEVKE